MPLAIGRVRSGVDMLVAGLDDPHGVPESVIKGIGTLITQVYGKRARIEFRERLECSRDRYWIPEDQAADILLAIKNAGVDKRHKSY